MADKTKLLRPWNVKPGMKIRLYDSTGPRITSQDVEILEVEPDGRGYFTRERRYRLTFTHWSQFWRSNYAIFYSSDRVEVVV